MWGMSVFPKSVTADVGLLANVQNVLEQCQ